MTYNIEYECLNLVCFNCGRYGHHKDNCPLLVSMEPTGKDKEENTNRRSQMNYDITEGTSRHQEGQNEVFGSWMVVKKNMRNRNGNRNQIRDFQGRKPTQTNTAQHGTNLQKIPDLNGSWFSIFGMEKDEVEKEAPVDEQLKTVKDLEIESPAQLQERTENLFAENNNSIQVDRNKNWNFQSDYSKSNEQNVRNSVLKGKNFMERFVNMKGKEKIPNSGALSSRCFQAT